MYVHMHIQGEFPATRLRADVARGEPATRLHPAAMSPPPRSQPVHAQDTVVRTHAHNAMGESPRPGGGGAAWGGGGVAAGGRAGRGVADKDER